MSLFLQFVYLQVLDVLTTLAFLGHGVHEGNPMVRFILKVASSPLEGLIVLKIAATVLAVYCWLRGRHRLLTRINVGFASLVVWNLVALLVSRAG